MEFLDLIETIRSEEASHERLFGDAGKSVRTLQKRPDYGKMMKEAIGVLNYARGSRYGLMRFEEAMGTADFPLLMGDVLDRQLLGEYMETPQTWSTYCRRATVPDFRTVKRFAVDGSEGRLPTVGEKAPYLPNVLTETSYSYAILKYGRLMFFDWEAFINDDLGALGGAAPARLAKAARRSEDYFATGLHVDSNGPHASVYTTAAKNIINTTNGAASTNPVLGIIGLQDAFTVMGLQLDADSEPIGVTGLILEVPPSLMVTARNILNATEIKLGADSGTQQLMTANWMRSNLTLVVNPYIPIIATTNGKTTWFVHASPSVGRPALEMGFLRGHETPELFQQSGNQSRLGGATSPMDGSFENDSIAYKIRHCFGGVALEKKSTYGSNGSGS